MNLQSRWIRAVCFILVAALIAPLDGVPQAWGQSSAAFSKAELAQMVAPIALYPDELLVQVLMASTYPMEIVKAARWTRSNKDLKGDALAAALEREDWDPSVKSLVNFPSVLEMMNEKLDWTQKLGDAFIAQEKDVMDTVQDLRRRAESSGNLQTTREQKVIVEQQYIRIEPAQPSVVYVPAYNPVVVYGAWAYPSYPPYPYYPPGYMLGAAAFSFVAGVAIGAAWGYAWGGANWGRGNVNVNINQNINYNRNINRASYQNKYGGGGGAWQHDSAHRQGVAYRDKSTAQKYGQSSARTSEAKRDARGYSDRGAAQSRDMSRQGSGGRDVGKASAGMGQAGRDIGKPAGGADRSASSRTGRESALSGVHNGSFDRSASSRGQMSRASSSSGGKSMTGGSGGSGGGARGGGGGGARGGGGGARGGGRK